MSQFDSKAAVENELSRVEEVKKSLEPVDFFVAFEPGELSRLIGSCLYLSIENFIALKNFFTHLAVLKKRFNKSAIDHYFNKFGQYHDVIDEINDKIDEDNQVRDSASETLRRIRKRKKDILIRIRQRLNELLERRGNLFTSLNFVERNNRFVLPVKSNFKKDLPGIVHSYSNTGETIFIEPMEITEDSAELFDLEDQEQKEIERILTLLTDFVRARKDDIENDIDTIVDLDILFAKARLAAELNGTMPIFGDHLNIVNGYHPILKRITDQVVPLSLKLNSHKRVLVISGPNAGGKTVVLKTVGLIILMAKYGLFITADEGTSMPYFDEIFADIGDEQSIESSLSTFAAHIKQIKNALDGKDRSLVLLDELMSQTSAEEGSALAAAIMETFSRKQSTVLATTHNENLKIFVSKRDDMLNGGMEYTDQPTYRLIVGIPQSSNALKLAAQMGMDQGIVKNAYGHLSQEKLSVHELFEDLSKELKAVHEERLRLSKLTDEYDKKLKELNQKKKKELEDLKTKYRNELIQSKRSIEHLIKGLKKTKAEPAKVQEAKDFFKSRLPEEEDRPPYFPRLGEIVRIPQMKRTGQVIAEHQGRYKVSLENMYFWVEPRDIAPVEERPKDS